MTKNEIIARLGELSDVLGRVLDVTGTIAELEMRLREAEEEYGVISEDDEQSLEIASNQSSAINEPDVALHIKIKPGVQSFHLRVLKGRAWGSALVTPGAEVMINSIDFDAKTMMKGGFRD